MSTAYCSQECQQADWHAHRTLCRSFRDFLHRPGLRFRRAIYFPTPFGSNPRLTWVEIVPNAPDWNGHDEPLLDDLLKASLDEREPIGRDVHMIRGNSLRAGDLDHVIELTCRDASFVRLSPNQSITRIGGSRWHSWLGPFVAMAKASTAFDPAYYQDIDLVDLHDIVDYLAWYRDGIGSAADGVGCRTYFAENHVLPFQKGDVKVKGVRVNARGDQIVCGRPPFELVDVPRRHPLFSYEGDDPSSLTEQLGPPVRPLCAKRYQPDPSWKDLDELPDRFDNTFLDLLYLDLDPESPGWGQRLERCKDQVGSILVVDRGGGDLSVEEVERLYRFGEDWVLPRVRQATQYEGATASRKAVLERLTIRELQNYGASLREA